MVGLLVWVIEDLYFSEEKEKGEELFGGFELLGVSA